MLETSKNDEVHTEPETDVTEHSADQKETPSRRELIQRYGKYAVVAAPLLLFVSKAHAIHSKP